MSTTLNFRCLYTDDDGVSHFAPLDVEMAPREFAPPFSVSPLETASRYGFLHLPAGWIGDLHPSPLRMWIIVLSGEMEFEAGDGEQQKIAPGSALLLEDTTGMGHCSRVLGNQPAVLAVVHV
ncbi:cupin domain-containing protein [Polaromonas sp. JS666]|uniref:cupin domain-containing protein n=1 Tax=Polaromonas sp. (strain JS666 / ATCC BAA-500) TaxID=296591 RepID=UPI00004644C5|nr:cupin domain-containing protein [Polaromonas sp. JS666]ABE46123.1 Cupin 2, conserved barrel [Polaromonas sp. JS666]